MKRWRSFDFSIFIIDLNYFNQFEILSEKEESIDEYR
jgi:hypothetical protein